MLNHFRGIYRCTYQEDTVKLSVLPLIHKLVIDYGPVFKMDRKNVSTRSVNKELYTVARSHPFCFEFTKPSRMKPGLA